MARKPAAVREHQGELFQRTGGTALEQATTIRQPRHNIKGNKVDPKDRHFHEWYRFVLFFPPHLVRTYLEKFSANEDAVVLDPFCGCGTTLIEGKLAGLRTIGVEANPFAHFASTTREQMREEVLFVEWPKRKVDLREKTLAGSGIKPARPTEFKAMTIGSIKTAV